jgi:hypothetical protein
MRLEKLLLEHTDFFLQRGVFRTQMGILRPHAHTRYVVPKGGSEGRLAAEMRPSKKLLSGDKLQTSVIRRSQAHISRKITGRPTATRAARPPARVARARARALTQSSKKKKCPAFFCSVSLTESSLLIRGR